MGCRLPTVLCSMHPFHERANGKLATRVGSGIDSVAKPCSCCAPVVENGNDCVMNDAVWMCYAMRSMSSSCTFWHLRLFATKSILPPPPIWTTSRIATSGMRSSTRARSKGGDCRPGSEGNSREVKVVGNLLHWNLSSRPRVAVEARVEGAEVVQG